MDPEREGREVVCMCLNPGNRYCSGWGDSAPAFLTGEQGPKVVDIGCS